MTVDTSFGVVLLLRNATGAAEPATRAELVDGSGQVRTWGVPSPLSVRLDGRSLSGPNRLGSSTGPGTTPADTSTPYITTAISYV